jgi:para-nitrobenzyl esterase
MKHRFESRFCLTDLRAAGAAWASLVAVFATAEVAVAEAPPPAPVAAAAAYVAIGLLPAKAGKRLKVSSPAFTEGGDVPFENTGWRGNVFPGLKWSKGPSGTRSYVVVLQDADALLGGKDAILHWTMYNIPANVTALAPGMISPPLGAVAGPNRNGPSGRYLGPRTGAGPKHRYPYQVFALDVAIPPDPELSWPALKAAMTGHVLASGQTVGLGQLDPTAPPAPPNSTTSTTPAK